MSCQRLHNIYHHPPGCRLQLAECCCCCRRRRCRSCPCSIHACAVVAPIQAPSSTVGCATEESSGGCGPASFLAGRGGLVIGVRGGQVAHVYVHTGRAFPLPLMLWQVAPYTINPEHLHTWVPYTHNAWPLGQHPAGTTQSTCGGLPHGSPHRPAHRPLYIMSGYTAARKSWSKLSGFASCLLRQAPSGMCLVPWMIVAP